MYSAAKINHQIAAPAINKYMIMARSFLVDQAVDADSSILKKIHPDTEMMKIVKDEAPRLGRRVQIIKAKKIAIASRINDIRE